MLGKLLKYEFKATARTFIPLYIALLIVSAINGIFMNTEMLEIQGVVMFLFGGLLVAMGVVTVVVIVQRFRKNLLDDEGYLMFTLPVSTNKLIFSKYIVSLIWTVLSVIVGILSFVIIMIIASPMSFKEFMDVMNEFSTTYKDLFYEGYWIQIGLTLIAGLSSYSTFILMVYTSVSMGQMPKFNKHRNIVSFATFFIINIIISSIQTFAFGMLGENFLMGFFGNEADMVKVMSTVLSMQIVWSLIILVILFVSTNYILDKKLNLE